MPDKSKEPAYLNSYKNNSLSKKIDAAFSMLKACCLCPRKCRINRLNNERGFCKTGFKPKIYSFMLHHGEEPSISGTRGSGTIFFSCCNMRCVYCQNYKFSQQEEGREVDFKELARIMLNLEKEGAHNINLVTPTHVLPQILKALKIAVEAGLKIPLIYNTNGYELTAALKLLSGIVDIYLPDMRYGDADNAEKYSLSPDYPGHNRSAIKEMHRQVGIAKFDNANIIKSGLVIRHLVLPHNLSGTDQVMRFIAKEISSETYISLMSQYAPYYKAPEIEELSRGLTYAEYKEAQKIMDKYGLSNGWIQEETGLERFAGTNIKAC